MDLSAIFNGAPSMTRYALALCLCLSFAACAEPPSPPSVGGCPSLAGAALVASRAPTRLLAIGSNYNSGTSWSAPLDARALSEIPLGVTGDTVLRPIGDALAVLNRSPGMGDNVTLFDLRGGRASLSCQLSPLAPSEWDSSGGARARPFVNVHDVLPLDDATLLLARYNLPSLAVVDLATGAVTRTLDLSPWSGAASPYPEAFARVGTSIWLTLGRLDDPFAPRQPGMVLRLDAQATRVIDAVELPRPNPSGPIVAAPEPRTWWVTTLGAYDIVGDGVIETLTERDGAVVVGEPLVTETELGGTIDAFAVVDANRLVLKVAVTSARVGPGEGDSLRYLLWNRRDRGARELLRRAAWSPAPPVVAGGRIWIGDPGDLDARGAGLRAFTLDGDPITAEPLSVGPGMRPYDLAVAP